VQMYGVPEVPGTLTSSSGTVMVSCTVPGTRYGYSYIVGLEHIAGPREQHQCVIRQAVFLYTVFCAYGNVFVHSMARKHFLCVFVHEKRCEKS